VMLPHHHGHTADLAVRHPAHLVLVMPLRQVRRLAEVTAGVRRERHGRVRVRTERSGDSESTIESR
jgi:hypothetical protein